LKSYFLEAFQKAKAEAGDAFYATGDVLLVESIPAEEMKSQGGIYIPSSFDQKKVDGLDMNKPTFCRVVLVGEGFYNEGAMMKGENGAFGLPPTVALDVEVGDIILVGPMAVKWLSVFGPLFSKGENQIGITRESEIQLRFKGQAGYERVCQILKDATTNAQVQKAQEEKAPRP
jgi:co-chaperonin GroES (HSP10)